MSHVKRYKVVHRKSQRTIDCKIHRDREVRDLYQKLMKKFRYDVVLQFLERNYFIQEGTLMHIMRRVDSNPVDMDRATIIYKVAMADNFSL